MHSAANGRIYNKTPFLQVYVGGALGAAFALHRDQLGQQFQMTHAY